MRVWGSVDPLQLHAIAQNAYNAALAPRDTAFDPNDAMHEAVDAVIAALEPAPKQAESARVDWTLTGNEVVEDDGFRWLERPIVAGPDLQHGEVVGLIRVSTVPCPDCNPGDSGCSTCDDFRVVRPTLKGEDE